MVVGFCVRQPGDDLGAAVAIAYRLEVRCGGDELVESVLDVTALDSERVVEVVGYLGTFNKSQARQVDHIAEIIIDDGVGDVVLAHGLVGDLQCLVEVAEKDASGAGSVRHLDEDRTLADEESTRKVVVRIGEGERALADLAQGGGGAAAGTTVHDMAGDR